MSQQSAGSKFVTEAGRKESHNGRKEARKFATEGRKESHNGRKEGTSHREDGRKESCNGREEESKATTEEGRKEGRS
jgi:hypothetical protein